jgi:hypothetical protein
VRDDRGMNTRTLMAALLLAAPLVALGQGSLTERRLAITKGTATGKVVLEAPAAASAPAAPAPAASAAARAAQPPRKGWFSGLPAPSGRSLNEARKFDAPDQGIVIKPAAPASAAR